jgi:hypothetical protein
MYAQGGQFFRALCSNRLEDTAIIVGDLGESECNEDQVSGFRWLI